MQQKEFDIQVFSTRIRDLIRHLNEVKTENTQLKQLVKEKSSEITRMQQQLATKDTEYKTLMTARMLSIADGNIDDAKKRVNDLLRAVNKCITLVNEK